MATFVARRQITLWVLLAFAVLGGIIGRTVSGHPTSPPPLPIYGALPGFTLIDQRGRSFSQAALAGRVWSPTGEARGTFSCARWAKPRTQGPAPRPIHPRAKPGAPWVRGWVANFIFTSCAGQCPLMTEQFRALQRALADEDAIAFVSFSVDPARDTPELFAAYTQRYGADPRWHLLAGERDVLWALCREGFGLAVESTPVSVGEPLTHSVRFVLVDRAGRLRGTDAATDAQAMARLRRDTRQLLEETS